MANNKLAIIGGSGLYDVEEFKDRELIKISTPWGETSDEILKTTYPNGKFILITSALHMPRAKRCFQKVNIPFTPYSVDHQSGPRKFILDHLILPNPESLRAWNALTKEWTGFIVYKLVGNI